MQAAIVNHIYVCISSKRGQGPFSRRYSSLCHFNDVNEAKLTRPSTPRQLTIFCVLSYVDTGRDYEVFFALYPNYETRIFV